MRALAESPQAVSLAQRDPAERVPIQIWYNGGFPRSHTVSVGFLLRLEAFLAKRPKLDVEWREMYVPRRA